MVNDDFNDANKNGVDDKDEKLEDRQTSVRGVDPQSGQTDTAAVNNMQAGASNFSSLLEAVSMFPGDGTDENWAAGRSALELAMMGSYLSTMQGMGQSQWQLGEMKDYGNWANRQVRLTEQERDNRRYQLAQLDKNETFRLADEFGNRDLLRNLTYSGALAGYTQDNFRVEGQQNRLGIITAGEQDRLGIAAAGEQSRLGTITAGEQQRLGIAATGQQTRLNIGAQGLQDRLGWQTQGIEQRKNIAATGVENRLQAMTEGKETRKNISATGVENRLQAQTEGMEQRKNIAATGVENRLQAVTEGEQKRLNIGKTAEEQRTTMSHSDNIAAGREKRQMAASRAAARAF